MEELKIKKFNIDEVDEITLLTIEQAKKIPNHILRCSDWWWLRSPGFSQFNVAIVDDDGDVCEYGDDISNKSNAVRPVFRISNLKSEIGNKIMVGKTLCTVIDEELTLADYSICKHKFDEESKNWETSELKGFINSDEFKTMI